MPCVTILAHSRGQTTVARQLALVVKPFRAINLCQKGHRRNRTYSAMASQNRFGDPVASLPSYLPHPLLSPSQSHVKYRFQ